jgi:hypothetical protein
MRAKKHSKKLVTPLVLVTLGWMVVAAHAAPIVVTPGSNSGYMYIPSSGTGSSGSNSSTSVTVNVSSSSPDFRVPESIMQASEAGTCASASTVGQTCTWGDGKTFKYAGLVPISGKKLFAEKIDKDFFYGPHVTLYTGSYYYYYLPFGSESKYDGLQNTNMILELSSFKKDSLILNSIFIFCQTKNMYVPAIYELNVLFGNREAIGGFEIHGKYWSSTSLNSNNAFAYYVDFQYNNGEVTEIKSNGYYVRCVRSF